MHKKNIKTKDDRHQFNRGEKSDETFLLSFSTFIQSPDIYYRSLEDDLKKTPEYESIKGLCKDANQTDALFMTLFPEKYLSFLKGTGKILSTHVLPVADIIFFSHHGFSSEAAQNYLLEKIKSA